MNSIKYIFNWLTQNRVSLITLCYNYKVWIWYLYRNWINITYLLIIAQHCIAKIILNTSIYRWHYPSIFMTSYSKYFFLKKFQQKIIEVNKDKLWLIEEEQIQPLEYFIYVLLQHLNLLLNIYKKIYLKQRGISNKKK